ncbi:hypothetical protein ACEWY4_010552 [Coilia grayii]|uniref:Uncharacterized protein n=1 Tax=Coilia grayii TaxID=363190 RepID=A0ABD1K2A2_9TELE
MVVRRRNIPRLKLHQDGVNTSLPYQRNLSHTVLFYQENSDSLFIGGTNYVLQVDLTNSSVLENYTLSTSEDPSCSKRLCENVITTIEDFQKDGLFVCGTNGRTQPCWMVPKNSSQTVEMDEFSEGRGIAPYTLTQNSLSLSLDGDLYSAAPLYEDGSSVQFRRTAGKRTNVWMFDRWVTEPTFISAFSVPLENDPDDEKIYVFFREKNSDNSPEADPWISRVARVCKVDEGGAKAFFQNIWTSFLKARLVCRIPGESLYFNRLQDIHFQANADWKKSRVYALFSSSWNSTAVCIYTIEEIDRVFQHSAFKGFDADIPDPRPGTCNKNSMQIPISTLNVIKDHSEMTDWIRPIQREAPFYVSSNNYTKIAVDQVETSSGTYNVLLLATETGTIHKILEDDLKYFIISETRLCNLPAPIQSMKLDTKRRKLIVGYPGQLSYLDLQRCQDYNTSCEECVLARDPYCSWTPRGCTADNPRGFQNIATGQIDVCPKKPAASAAPHNSTRRKRQTLMSSPDPQRVVHTVPLDFPVYLSCPIDSQHATYTWEHGGQTSGCQWSDSDCLFLIPAMDRDSYGLYRCISRERGYTRVLREYQLVAPVWPMFTDNTKTFSDTSQITSHLTLMVLVVLMVVLL